MLLQSGGLDALELPRDAGGGRIPLGCGVMAHPSFTTSGSPTPEDKVILSPRRSGRCALRLCSAVVALAISLVTFAGGGCGHGRKRFSEVRSCVVSHAGAAHTAGKARRHTGLDRRNRVRDVRRFRAG